ncbi:uncharacterized protein LOC114529383 isoform X1 [Dendronephthya gigantea]|uniref:uncharacterized protein LOC114529383 isoform X1 n=1 Tax=Dendronephthya gigantea TaxID=151771 RepID=UPI00106C4FFC|nr:uncharacterized protein LOC114529383 isoform X1 [Dendronephthya gigantea]
MKLMKALLVFVFTICYSETGEASLVRGEGNNTIIALLPFHTPTADSKQCSNELHFKSAVQSQALVYAVKKLNSDPNFGAMISLGYDVEDICGDKPEHLLNVINTLFKRHKRQHPCAFVADLSNFLTRLVVRKSQKIPVFSLDSAPDDIGAFYLEPKKPRIGKAAAKFVQELNWTVFDVLVANESSYEYFKEATKTLKVCENRVLQEKFVSSQNLANESNPILVFSDSLKTLKNLPSTLKERDTVIAGDVPQTGERFAKTLALKQRVPNLSEFKTFLLESAGSNDSWFGALIRDSAQFKNCATPGNKSCLSEILEKLSGELRHGGKVIDAVYTIAHTLKRTQKQALSNDDIISTPEFTSATGNPICFSSNKVLEVIDYSVYNLGKTPPSSLGKIQTFSAKTSAELSLDELDLNRDITSCLLTCPKGTSPVPTSAKCCVECKKNPNLSPNPNSTANTTACKKGLRLNKDGSKCIEVRLDYLKWKHPLSIVIFLLAIFLFFVLLYLVNLYHIKAQTPALLTSKLATMLLLLSLFITLIHPLLPIIKPSASACNAYVFGFVQALGIPLCILISRSNSYFKRFRQEDGSLRKKVCRSNPQNLIAIFLILFQIILSIIFIAVSSAHVVYYETSDPSVDYIECSTFSGGEFLFPFFYTIILSLVFTVKNFGAETIEHDSYESHFTAIFFFGFYFLSFLNIIIVYGVTGKTKVMLICVLGVLHVINFLFFIFFPKVYVVVFKRDPVRFRPPVRTEREVLIFDLSGIEDDPPKTKK